MMRAGMDKHSRFRLSDDVWLDAQRALWIESEGLLAVADLHLGYAWVHRARGQLLPLAPDDTTQRLLALQQRYQPRRFVLLGDIVHGLVSRPEIGGALRQMLSALGDTGSEPILVSGNHDRGLSRFFDVPVIDQFRCGDYLFIHGDTSPVQKAARLTVIGHEHPAIRLGDGITGSTKCPCFLVSDDVIVLPAFSNWAAGSPIVDNSFMSGIAKGARFTKAIAIVGGKLLPVPLT